MNRLTTGTFLTAALLSTPILAHAGQTPIPPPLTPERSPFEAGRIELQSGTGAFWSFIPDNSERDTINYFLSSYRLGVMLSTANGNGIFRGNTELLLEGFYGSVFDGPGDWLAGGTLMLRYNFVQPETKWIPYIQIGAGGLWNDIYKDESQQLIGQSFEFNVQASLGIRYQINSKWAVTLEGGYRHISNADMADRNRGLDSLGGLVGIVYTF